MDCKTAQSFLNNLVIAMLLLAMAACSSSSDAGPDCRFNENWLNGQCRADPITVTPITLPGGIWRGVDADNRDVVVLMTVFGGFQFVDAFGNQGSGNLAVGDGDSVASNFQLVTQQGATFADGTTLANCTFSGTIVERQSLTMTQSCVTTAGLEFQESLVLQFDTLYNRDASLAIIAGMYETPAGSILSIASDGMIFLQDAVSGCVTNGQVSMTLSNANMYLYEYAIDNCTGADAIWNGSRFAGLAVLDDTISPDSLIFAMIGDVGTVAISLFVVNPRV